MAFEDHFSRRPEDYLRYRPTYPDELFAWLASLVSRRETAWDCATGNGQAALGLARYVQRVIATDASSEQIASAIPHERIEYRVMPAEKTDIPEASVDLVAVASALHWLDPEPFYAEVRRVVRPGGIIAAWSYREHEIEPAVGDVIMRYSREVVGSYWSPNIQRCWAGYRTIPFPFEAIATPEFSIERSWTMEEVLGFLGTWSSSQSFVADRGYDPRREIAEEFEEAWGDPRQRRIVRWPLVMRVGRIQATSAE